jgi:DNA-binding GntR family transcriptional regulator
MTDLIVDPDIAIDPVGRMTASSRAHQTIREMIFAGHYAPGERLKEDDLTLLCGVSRTPVREALRRLAAEGLVIDNPHHGVQVAVVQVADLEEIYTLRAMVESHAAARAATRITGEQIARLKALAAVMEDAIEEGEAADRVRFIPANAEFHRCIWEAAMSPRLAHMAALVVELPLTVRTFSSYSADDRRRSAVHHRDIIAAFEARSPDWASSVMSSHIHAAFQALARSHKAMDAKA